jgi:uncharacterized protein (TIGR02270 family)
MEIIAPVVQQHLEDAADLYSTRTLLCGAPHVKLHHLRRFDDRTAAHLDGLTVAGDGAQSLYNRGLQNPSAGILFCSAIRAFALGLDAVVDVKRIAGAFPEGAGGFVGAFEWTEWDGVRPFVRMLLSSDDDFGRFAGVAACASHGRDPGFSRGQYLGDTSARVRARALRGAGELGLADTADLCVQALRDEDENCAGWAAWALSLFGRRGRSIQEALFRWSAGPRMRRSVLLQSLAVSEVHAILRQQSAAGHSRRVIENSGVGGDPTFVPWLITQMVDPNDSRAAGEAFSFITGVDLALLDLERKPPENFESGPNDDPDDPNVEMDPDEGLPWPDVKKVEDWWHANAGRFQKGTRYFMGQPVTKEHCIHVLKTGYQRQRILAAQYLCLLEPGTPLFITAAPAWRQQRLLAAM